ncbi:hypothetical protein AAMO2058_000452800 [Amorphochlora amoebiformis]
MASYVLFGLISAFPAASPSPPAPRNTIEPSYTYVQLDSGGRVQLVEYGDAVGQPLLVLHGWPDSLHTYDLVYPFLAKRKRVIGLSFPGFGNSDSPSVSSGILSIPGFVQVVKSVVKKLEIQSKFELAGHSMGSFVAWLYASKYPTDVESLILIDPAPTAHNHSSLKPLVPELAKLEKQVSVVPYSFAKAFQFSTFYNISAAPTWFSTQVILEAQKAPPYVWRALLHDMITHNRSDSLRYITARTCVLRGEHDNTFPLSDSLAVFHGLTSARFKTLKIIPSAAHSPIWDAPEDTARVMLEFLGSSESRRSDGKSTRVDSSLAISFLVGVGFVGLGAAIGGVVSVVGMAGLHLGKKSRVRGRVRGRMEGQMESRKERKGTIS